MAEGHFEAVKYAYRQSKDGFVLSFVVHPNDMPDALATAPIGTAFMIGFASIESAGGTDLTHSGSGQPRERLAEVPPAVPKDKRTWGELAPSEQAGIRLGEPAFWALLNRKHGDPRVTDRLTADQCLKNWFGITSKRELNADGPDRLAWERVDTEYSKSLAYRDAR